MKRSLRWLLLLGLIAAPGCGTGLTTYPVSGVVTLDDQPLPNASVVFTPLRPPSSTQAPGSAGRTDSNGKFSLKVLGARGQRGAVSGMHRVSITLNVDLAEDDDSNLGIDAQKIPPRYNINSELTYEVKTRSANDDANFNLESKK